MKEFAEIAEFGFDFMSDRMGGGVVGQLLQAHIFLLVSLNTSSRKQDPVWFVYTFGWGKRCFPGSLSI